ncbi:MAG: topoisomerase C-terminal repeat-containing protein [Clostridia bacterium]|nr:topoisomerase C-terminal repeat-containing protein [Clostridia bacterium]
MILIIAEKPSLARNINAGIGNMTRRNGYFEGGGYIVTWAFGHLFSLCDVEDYGSAPLAEGEKARWTLDNLPCFPEKFKFKLRKDDSGKPDDGVRNQFNVIKSLCLRDDVDTIVNAGDADREGEIIVRLCVLNSFGGRENAENSGKALKRLWLPDQTPETVKAALADLKDETEYENLANEGFARTYIDWLYGVNLTRYATIRTGRLLRVGRVIVPIVKAIYDRDMAIRYFKPEKYFGIASEEETKGCKVQLVSKLRFEGDREGRGEYSALSTCEKYNREKALVTDKKTKNETVKPGKLYSLSKLQNVLGKKYKMPMEKSLATVQKLYEAGYLTYPRTNSEYLASAEKDKIKKVIGVVAKLGYNVKFRDDKTIFDDSKIESHSAITPTYIIPDKSKLTEEELIVYSTVMRRFAAVFCAEPCLAEKTEITVKVDELEEFVLKGTVVKQKGFMKYDDGGVSDKILPPLEKGDEVNINFKPVERETTPPKHYTIETLNNYLKNPFREEKALAAKKKADGDKGDKDAASAAAVASEGEDEQSSDGDESGDGGYGEDDAEEYRMILEGLELGTEATRTGIIDNAIKSKYIQLKKDVYTILPDGEFLIEAIGGMHISMDKHRTSELGRTLKQIFRGKTGIAQGLDEAKKEVAEVFEKRGVTEPAEEDTNFGTVGDKVGKCPLCGGDVVRTFFGYGCSNYSSSGCKFSVRLIICGRPVSAANVKLLLEQGRTSKIKGFRSKTGNLFDAYLKLDGDRAVFDFDRQ